MREAALVVCAAACLQEEIDVTGNQQIRQFAMMLKLAKHVPGPNRPTVCLAMRVPGATLSGA